eukprot:4703878-Amphidinium_carterae.1
MEGALWAVMLTIMLLQWIASYFFSCAATSVDVVSPFCNRCVQSFLGHASKIWTIELAGVMMAGKALLLLCTKQIIVVNACVVGKPPGASTREKSIFGSNQWIWVFEEHNKFGGVEVALGLRNHAPDAVITK